MQLPCRWCDAVNGVEDSYEPSTYRLRERIIFDYERPCTTCDAQLLSERYPVVPARRWRALGELATLALFAASPRGTLDGPKVWVDPYLLPVVEHWRRAGAQR